MTADSYVTYCCAAFVSMLLWKDSSVSVPLSLYRFGLIYNLNTIYTVNFVSWANIQFLERDVFSEIPHTIFFEQINKYVPSSVRLFSANIFIERTVNLLLFTFHAYRRPWMLYTNGKSTLFLTVHQVFVSRKIHTSYPHIHIEDEYLQIKYTEWGVWIRRSQLI